MNASLACGRTFYARRGSRGSVQNMLGKIQCVSLYINGILQDGIFFVSKLEKSDFPTWSAPTNLSLINCNLEIQIKFLPFMVHRGLFETPFLRLSVTVCVVLIYWPKWAARFERMPIMCQRDGVCVCVHAHTHTHKQKHLHVYIDRCCFHYFIRNSLVAFLEALFARIFLLHLSYRCTGEKKIAFIIAQKEMM